MLLATTAAIVLLAPAQAGAGRQGREDTVADMTVFPEEIFPDTELTFVANLTSDLGCNNARLYVDGFQKELVASDPSDYDSSDGMLFKYTGTFRAGTHTYMFSFYYQGNYTNSTEKSFSVRWAPSTGDWVLSGRQEVRDAAIELRGNLIVPSGASLEIWNTTITFNGAIDGQYRLEVQNGGSLRTHTSTLFTKAPGARNWNFMVKPGAAAFELRNCQVLSCGWAGPASNLTGLYSEAALSIIKGCLVAGGYNGIIQDGGKLDIKDSTVRDSTSHNLVGNNTTIEAYNCTFQHSAGACNVVFLNGTAANVTHCLITDSGRNGLRMNGGVKALISECHIEDSRQSAIWADDRCTLTVQFSRCDRSTMEGAWINGSRTVTMVSDIFEHNGLNGTWISSSTVNMTNVTVRNNNVNGVSFIASRLTIDRCTVDGNGMLGVAGYDSRCTFTKNHAGNNKMSNYAATNCTTTIEDCSFDASLSDCNLGFFTNSRATVNNAKIRGAGDHCIRLGDRADVVINGSDIGLCPGNVIRADSGAKATVRNCILHGSGNECIRAANSTIIVEDCSIQDYDDAGGAEGWGIQVENCSLNVSGITFTNNPVHQIWVKHYLDVRTFDDKGGILTGAAVRITDDDNNVVFSGKSEKDGGIGGPQLLTSYIQYNDGNRTDCIYTVTVSKGDLKGSQDVPLSGPQMIDITTKAHPKANAQSGFGLLAVLAALIITGALVAGRRRR